MGTSFSSLSLSLYCSVHSSSCTKSGSFGRHTLVFCSIFVSFSPSSSTSSVLSSVVPSPHISSWSSNSSISLLFYSFFCGIFFYIIFTYCFMIIKFFHLISFVLFFTCSRCKKQYKRNQMEEFDDHEAICEDHIEKDTIKERIEKEEEDGENDTNIEQNTKVYR